MDIARYFADVGRRMEHRWAASGSAEAAMPDAAVAVLEEIDVPSDLTPAAILGSTAELGRTVRQEDLEATFAQPPITVYRSERFFISVLYWLDGTTAIHEHGFSGAFRVLHGSSIHARYRFEPEQILDRRLQAGHLTMQGVEVLETGDVRPIRPGSVGAHALFHLERPSVTMVVRSYGEPWLAPQLTYLRPGLAYDPFAKDRELQRPLQALTTLRVVDADAARELGESLITSTSAFGAFNVLMHWFRHCERGDDFSRLVETAARQHAVLSDLVVDVFVERKREMSLVVRRQMLHDPRHRLFLAVLLNLPDVVAQRKVLGRLLPDEPPREAMAGLLRELASPALRGLSGLHLSDEDLDSLTAAMCDDAGQHCLNQTLESVSRRIGMPDLLQRVFAMPTRQPT